MNTSKNDIAWQKIFDKHHLLDKIAAQGYCFIDSKDINEFREARLMTKFDHRSQLPKLFVDNNLCILPTSRGGYIISDFETFHPFNTDEVAVTSINFPLSLESLDYKDITSEATAINCAFVSKILHDFTGEKELLPTVSGRMSSSNFEFNINCSNGTFNIKVDNSQVEIDGGYEGADSLILIEAKNYISDDFLVRQLYYPYRLWANKIRKRVRPIFLTYTNGIFHLREYTFDDAAHYNSLSLVKEKKYAVQDSKITIVLIRQILERVQPVSEPEVPFPQADSFERVINLCELARQKTFLSKEEITHNYDFDERQTDYYINAGRYLELLQPAKENGQSGCVLTATGNRIFTLSITERQLEFIKLILSHSVFRLTLTIALEGDAVPAKNKIVEMMKSANLYKVNSQETYVRRASTIIGWIKWILKQIQE